MDHTIAGQHIGRRHRRTVDHDHITIDRHGQLGTIHRGHRLAIETKHISSQNLTRNHVVGQNPSQILRSQQLLSRQPQIIKGSGKRLIGRGEHRERPITRQGVNQTGSLSRRQQGGKRPSLTSNIHNRPRLSGLIGHGVLIGRGTGDEDGVDHVDHTIAGQHIGRRHRRTVDHDHITIDRHGQLGTIHRGHRLAIETKHISSQNLTRNHVVGQNPSQILRSQQLLSRQPQIIKGSGKRLIGRGEHRERPITRQGVNQTGSLSRRQQGGKRPSLTSNIHNRPRLSGLIGRGRGRRRLIGRRLAGVVGTVGAGSADEKEGEGQGGASKGELHWITSIGDMAPGSWELITDPVTQPAPGSNPENRISCLVSLAASGGTFTRALREPRERPSYVWLHTTVSYDRRIEAQFDIEFDPTHAAASETRQRARGQLDAAGLASRDAADLELIIAELASNAVEQQPAAPVRLTITISPSEVAVRMANKSTGEPLRSDEPDLADGSLAERGRGLAIVDALTDELTWEDVADGWTVIRCRRSLDRPPA